MFNANKFICCTITFHFKDLKIDISYELYASFTGNSTRNIYEKLKQKFGLQDDIEKLTNTKRNLFNDAFDNKQDLFLLAGVENLIKDLHQNGMQLVLASSSANITIEKIFNRFGLHQYFSHIVSGEDFPESKPHPAIFEHAAFLSQTAIENCIVIEDSTNGILAANAAGIYCIGYNSLHSELQDLSSANQVIQHFNELNFDIIRNLKQS